MKKLCAGMALMPIGVTAAMAQQKPNILVIVADDMARCELGCYGGQNLATPNGGKSRHKMTFAHTI